MERTVKCKYCGKTFITTDKRKKFCNDYCRSEYYNNYRKEHYREAYKRMLENDPDKIRRYQKQRREMFKEGQYRNLARDIMELCSEKDAEDKITKYLLENISGVKRKEIKHERI